jgi:DNA-binding transcriptional LysR family regulator
MNLRQLECFVAAVDEGSFTRAARRLGIAQPSLSGHIRALEDEVGGQLLARLPRGVAPTAAGRALLPEARACVRAHDRAKHAVRATLAAEEGELEVATVLSMSVGLLPPAIAAWQQRHPRVTIRLHEFVHRRLLEDSVERGVADLAVGPLPLREWGGPLRVVAWEEFVVVLSRNDPLAERGSVDVAELADREWVLYQPSHGLDGIVEEICRRAGFSPRGHVRTSQAEAAARLAAGGLGPAIVPDNVVSPGLEGAVLRLEPRTTRDVAVYSRVELSASASAFADVLAAQHGPRPRDAHPVLL